MAQLPTLTICTVCKNNERTIAHTLASAAQLTDSIFAYDSGSTDRTLELLKQHNAATLEGPWLGHVKTKQHILKHAAEARPNDWLLHLDSDEPILPDLADALADFIQSPRNHRAARLNRVVYYQDKPLRHAWQPEHRLRLVRAQDVLEGQAFWTGRDPHDRLEAPAPILTLPGALRHDSFETFAEHFRKQADHAQTAARAMLEEGRTPSFIKLITSPPGAFFKQLILKQSFRDGPPGWLAATSTAAGSLMKHAAHLEQHLLQTKSKSPNKPNDQSHKPLT